VLHGAVLGLSAHLPASSPSVTRSADPVEVDLVAWGDRVAGSMLRSNASDAADQTSLSVNGQPAAPDRAMLHRTAPSRTAPNPTVLSDAAPDAAGIGFTERPVLGEPAAEPPRTAGAALELPPRTIDISLSSAANRAAILGALDSPAVPEPAASKPSIGLLTEGLAEMDAQKGISPSSPAIGVAYQSARSLAPATGTAVFELQSDPAGLVHTVRVLSASTDQESWKRVAERLQQLLASRRLRVPQGANGVVTRLRIDRGALAQPLAERGRTKRGAALGQAPLHPKQQTEESTRASLEPGQLSPTLGVTVAGGATAPATRVVVVSERYL